MSRFAFTLIALCGFLTPASAVVAPKKAQSPMTLLKSTQTKIEGLLQKKIAKSNKKALAEREKKVRAIIEPYFAFELLAKRTLAAHWSKRSKAEQKSFTFWLRGLLEQAYLRGVRSNVKKIKGQTKPKITYKKQQLKGSNARVFTEVRYLKIKKRRGRIKKKWQTVRVDWDFLMINNSWKVVDIHTNDNSLIDTYKEQFNKIIAKKGYKELVRRIQKKVNQLRKKRGLAPLKEEK